MKCINKISINSLTLPTLPLDCGVGSSSGETSQGRKKKKRRKQEKDSLLIKPQGKALSWTPLVLLLTSLPLSGKIVTGRNEAFVRQLIRSRHFAGEEQVGFFLGSACL